MKSQTMMPTPRSVAVPAASAWCAAVFAPLLLSGAAQAAQFTVIGPAGSGEFGRSVTTLPNGNIIVTDPGFDAPGPVADVGAVHLYRPTGVLISTLRGSSANDRVGSGGVDVLTNGNYVVRSPDWDHGATTDAGAVTFASGTGGVSGAVSSVNSLVGSRSGDRVGSARITALTNGNYVVRSPDWDSGATADVGAVTFGSGTDGVSGGVSAANSLVGSRSGDRVGSAGVTALTNGNYVVRSPDWDNGAITDAGAATFGSGTSGNSGAASAANSLVGSATGDRVGGAGVTALTNGNYVVSSHSWDNGAIADAGAATFGSGTTGISGAVSAANSLVGGTSGDQVGFGTGAFAGNTVTALSNGNYVVASPNWDNGPSANAGAATFGSGTSGISGLVSATNSLVGSKENDRVGFPGVTALSNGNYVVASRSWGNGTIINAGAATFGSGTVGISGLVSTANSLVGGATSAQVGAFGVTALSNGNYVVCSPFWNEGMPSFRGAATFGLGTSGITGVVSSANSLVGSSAGDRVCASQITALSNGNYVVSSYSWSNDGIAFVGAVTFGSGTTGISGAVSAANSLVGGAADDSVGQGGVIALTNGSYVVSSWLWKNGGIGDVGAVTFGSGTSGITGVVSPANSLVGSNGGDRVGDGGQVSTGVSGVTAVGNGNYVVNSPRWNNGAGAITLALSDGSVVGPITSTHSVLGTVAGAGASQTFAYDAARNQLAVGQPDSNRVVLHRTGIGTAISITGDMPDPSIGGQPVTFTASIIASPNPPADGRVTFAASSGESCVDTTPTATSATTADFSCTITFTAGGVGAVFAEYTGSIIHAYSGSGPEPHTTIVDPVFTNGFEGL